MKSQLEFGYKIMKKALLLSLGEDVSKLILRGNKAFLKKDGVGLNDSQSCCVWSTREKHHYK